jgi:hypothetical protein
MRILLKITSIVMLFSSCSSVKRDIEGKWKSTFISPEFANVSKVHFEDFDLFEKSKFEPVIYFSGDSLRYDLGFGGKDLQFQQNYSKVIVMDEKLAVHSGVHYEVFELRFSTDEEFCLFKNDKKLACFTQLDNTLDEECESYSIDLRVVNEYYDIQLQLSPTRGQIIRTGLKSDTTVFKVNNTEEKIIGRLVSSINDENFKPQTGITGGDYSEYELKLNCGDKTYVVKLHGLRDISFELRALVKNLENYIRVKFS